MDEADAWAEVEAGWDDEARHRAYLARFPDLDGLARAGARYREVLAARPDDPVARRWRDEVLRRAVAAGLASIPRERPAQAHLPRWVRLAAVGVLVVVIAALSWALARVVLSWETP